MNRLDLMIARLSAQRACLVEAARLVAAVEGPVLEIGFGKGRTYSLLRELLPEREIYAFDRDGAPDTDWGPDATHFFAGEFSRTFGTVLARTGAPAALAHADFGSEDDGRDRRMADWMSTALPPLVRRGGLIVSDRELSVAGAERLPLPADAGDWPYFILRLGA